MLDLTLRYGKLIIVCAVFFFSGMTAESLYQDYIKPKNKNK